MHVKTAPKAGLKAALQEHFSACYHLVKLEKTWLQVDEPLFLLLKLICSIISGRSLPDEDGREAILEILKVLHTQVQGEEAPLCPSVEELKARILTTFVHSDNWNDLWRLQLCSSYLQNLGEEHPELELYRLEALLLSNHPGRGPKDIVELVQRLLEPIGPDADQESQTEESSHNVIKFLVSDVKRFCDLNKPYHPMANDSSALVVAQKQSIASRLFKSLTNLFLEDSDEKSTNELIKELFKDNDGNVTEEKQMKILNNLRLVHVYSRDPEDLTNLDPLTRYLIQAKKAVKETFGYSLRTAQILAVILMIFNHEDSSNGHACNGNLYEIATGEGKSIIVAVLAGYLAKIKGGKVDVLTSSHELARREAEHMSKFFKHLELTCKAVDRSYNSGKYDANICYGSASAYIFDVLRDESRERNKIRGDRPFSYLILDEVDKIVIDDFGHSYMISQVSRYIFAGANFDLVWAARKEGGPARG